MVGHSYFYEIKKHFTLKKNVTCNENSNLKEKKKFFVEE